MEKVCVWWNGFNGHAPDRIYYFNSLLNESAGDYLNLCRDLGWDWALFEDNGFESSFILTDKSF